MRYHVVLAGFILFISFSLCAQIEEPPSFEDTLEVYQDLFYLNEPLDLTLKFDMKAFGRSRHDEKYHPAELTCRVSETFQVTHEVRVKARGFWRLNNCDPPPYWMNIRHAGIEAEELADVIKMKVVSSCHLNSSLYERYVLREYLVYKLYNLISPYSFNVRLVKLHYIDTGRKNKESENWGFIIEPEEMMAERNNCMPIKSDRLSVRTVNEPMMDLVAAFSYMVGQGDFSVTGRHNIKILASKEYNPDNTGYIPIPYDFDYCGLVDTQYAIPGENSPMGISSVRERYYLGACRSEEEYQKAFDELASHRDEMNDLILNFEYMEEKEKEKMLDYLDSYFEETQQKNFIQRRIASTCLQ